MVPYFSPGTHDHRARKYYEHFHLGFVGFGWCDSAEGGEVKESVTFQQCLQFFEEKRSGGGYVKWNAVLYYYKRNRCEAYFGCRGNRNVSYILHYGLRE